MHAASPAVSSDLARVARRTLVVLALVALALLLWKIAPVLMLLFAGVVFASALRAGAVPLSKRTGMRESVAVAIVALLVAVVAATGIYLFGQQIARQAQDLWDAVKEAAGKVTSLVENTPVGETISDNVRASTNGDAMKKVAKGTVTVFGAAADIALVIFLSIYLAADPHTYRRGLLALLPRSVRGDVGEALEASGVALRKWLGGQLLAMLIVGTGTGLGLWLVGVPLAIPLGILLGILDFIPVVGPLMGAVPGLLIAFAHSPQLALYAGGVYLAMQFIEGHLVLPLVQRRAVSLPPALTLLGIVAFGTVFGAPGVLFAMPLLVVVSTMVQRLYVPRVA